jgi:hypothetical protein
VVEVMVLMSSVVVLLESHRKFECGESFQGFASLSS